MRMMLKVIQTQTMLELTYSQTNLYSCSCIIRVSVAICICYSIVVKSLSPESVESYEIVEIQAEESIISVDILVRLI